MHHPRFDTVTAPRTGRWFVSVVILAFVLIGGMTVTVRSQELRPGPGPDYFRGVLLFREGNFSAALQSFGQDLKNGNIKFGTNVWIDAVCSHAMIGECYYQVGQFTDAEKSFAAALHIFLQNSTWATRLVVDDPTPQPRHAVPWGKSMRHGMVATFASRFSIELGERFPEQAIKEGKTNVLMAAVQVQLDAPEVVRCLALAIRHRAEILGPFSSVDTLNTELAAALVKPVSAPNHWSGCWFDVLYGLVLSAQGKVQQAKGQLEKGAFIGGTLDHHLTAVAMYENGNLLMSERKWAAARDMYYEAGLAALYFDDVILLEESFRQLAVAQRYVDPGKPCLFLRDALRYFQNGRQRNVLVLATLGTECADDALQLKEYGLAKQFLDAAHPLVRSRDLANSRYAAKLAYLLGWGTYSAGKIPEGEKLSGDSLAGIYQTSLLAYHLQRLDSMVLRGDVRSTGPITPLFALNLYDKLLGIPTPQDWMARTADLLAMKTMVSSDSYMRWLTLTLLQNNQASQEKGFQIVEYIRSLRFQSKSPLAGRVHNLRMLLSTPVRELPQNSLIARAYLLQKYPEYGQLSVEAQKVMDTVYTLSLVPQNEAQLAVWLQASGKLAAIAQRQEGLLRVMAMAHEPSPEVFPPQPPLKYLQQNIPEGTSVLSFFEIGNEYYGFLVTKDRFDTWKVGESPLLRNEVAKFLQLIGSGDPNKALTLKELGDSEWKMYGENLHRKLLGGQKQPPFRELVVVPDGFLWYLPFETLTVNIGAENEPIPLIAVEGITLRYAPCVAFAIPSKLGRSAIQETLVVQGKFYPKDETTMVSDAIQKMQARHAAFTVIPSGQLPIPLLSWLPRMRQLVVLDDIITNPRTGPVGWSPFQSTKNNVSVSHWMLLPWGAPKLVVLPAFHTPAETALRLPGNGEELFLTSMSFLAAGVQTVSINRWKTGGRSSLDLTDAFLRNYSEMSAPMAWKKAVFSAADKPVSPLEEPRIKVLPNEQVPLANHPFFWAGAMLIDRGETAAETEAGDEVDGAVPAEGKTLLETLLQEQ